MSGEILRLKPEEVEKLIKQGKMKIVGHSTDSPPAGSKPDETSTQQETPINTGVELSKKGIGRRRFLGILALVGLTLGHLTYTGSEFDSIVDYLTPLPDSYRGILRNQFIADELPKGWYQVKSYIVRRSVAHNAPLLVRLIDVAKFGGSEVSSATINLQIPGKEEDTRLYGIPMIDFTDFESSERAQTASKQYQYPGSRSVSGIGDMAWIEFYNSPPNTTGRIFVVDDKILITTIVKGDEQTVLDLAKSAVKYLARIGVTPKKP